MKNRQKSKKSDILPSRVGVGKKSNKNFLNSVESFPNGAKRQEKSSKGIWSKSTLVPFAISMLLMIFQQWSGVNTVIFNSVSLFSAAKISMNEHLSSNIIGVVQLLATASKYNYTNHLFLKKFGDL